MAISLPLSAVVVIVLVLALSHLDLATSHHSHHKGGGGGGGGTCRATEHLKGKASHCNTKNDPDCCKPEMMYPQFHCSPPITAKTHATMTINSFTKGGDGRGPSECDNKYHNDNENVVALSIGWYNGGKHRKKNIRIHVNGRTVLAKVVDECDSVRDCNTDNDFQPPCANNIMDASPAV